MYRHLSLLRLAELIARNGDRDALRELHNNRSVFYYHHERPLRLVEFMDELRQSKSAWRWCNREVDILDQAYDVTISKFSNLPSVSKNGHPLKADGPNCRYYYKAFIEHAAAKIETESYSNEAEKEMRMAELLQKLVIRHFHLSCLECHRRARSLTRRYLWRVNGHTLSIFIPVRIPGNQCGKWLIENIDNVDPSRPAERDRVQAIVDKLLARQMVLSLDSIDENEIAVNSAPYSSEIEHEITVRGLAGAVAQEKADNIQLQRPAIRQLGKDKLKNLIHQVFDSLTRGEYMATSIANNTGISQSTFSRFAGSRWLTPTNKVSNASVPDLWRNTAHLLAGHPVFVKVAQAAGVWKRVEQIAESSTTTRNGACNE